MPKHRMPRSLVALSASAVAAIYLAGYVRTQGADASLDVAQVVAAAASPSALATALPPTSVPTLVPRSRDAVRTSGGVNTLTPPTSATTPSSPTSPGIPVGPTPAPTQGVPAAPAVPAAPGSQVAGLKDGTFSGQGQSRRGGVWVDVTVAGGRISAVKITRSTLQYPVRDIAGLPDQVVQRQTASVDVVSGATYSTQAFRSAVSQALAAARA